MVIAANWSKFDIFNFKGFFFNVVKFHHWNSRVFVFSKNVVKNTFYGILNAFFCKNIGRMFLNPVKRTNIIESENMVDMFVRHQDGPKSFNIFAQHLLTEIGTGVNNKIKATDFQKQRRAKSFIACIIRTANFAIAANYRNSLRGSGSKKSGFYLQFVSSMHAANLK